MITLKYLKLVNKFKLPAQVRFLAYQENNLNCNFSKSDLTHKGR